MKSSTLAYANAAVLAFVSAAFLAGCGGRYGGHAASVLAAHQTHQGRGGHAVNQQSDPGGHAMQHQEGDAGGHVMNHRAADTSQTLANTVCPIMGGRVKPDTTSAALTRMWHDKRVGFCCGACPKAWDQLTDAGKEGRLAAAVHTGANSAGHGNMHSSMGGGHESMHGAMQGAMHGSGGCH